MVKKGIIQQILLIVTTLGICNTIAEDPKAESKFCEIPFGSKKFYSHQWPLIFHENGDFYKTEKSIHGYESVIIKENEEVILSCSPNYIRSQGRTEKLRVSCQNNGMFKILNADAMFTPQNLTCDLRVVEEIESEVFGCPKDSTKFGYINPNDNMAYIFGESCYDTKEGRTLFAHVKLGAKNYLEKNDKKYLMQHHPSSIYKLELFRNLHFDEIYKRITDVLGITYAPQFSIRNLLDEKLLSHNQLIATKKLAWNYILLRDELTVWDLLKNDIRSFSAEKNLDVYVGCHGVNVLEKESVKLPLYIYEDKDKHKFPVPEIVWALVKHEKQAVFFGVYNNPFATPSKICKSECDKITWLKSVKNSKDENALICCDYNEAKKIFTEIPDFNDITDLFI